MATEVYGTTGIPGDSTTVQSGSTVAAAAAFVSSLGLVGGMNVSAGSATPGEVQTVQSSTNAQTLFGEDSELKRQIDAALTQSSRPTEIFAVGVEETTTTESFSGVQDGVLDSPNGQAFDPNIHDEHSFTVTDTTEAADVTVEIVYDTGTDLTGSPPSEANTMKINPISKEWVADESSDYDIDYTYGDYDTAITEIAKRVPRTLGVLTENTSTINSAVAEANSYDVDFDFMHVVAGAMPQVTATNYSDSFDERRLSVVAPPRAFTDTAETVMQRTIGGVAGKQAGKALGDSTTYEGLAGYTSLNTSYTNTEIADLISAQVYPLKQSGGIRVMKDMTTSTDEKFERVYASEIIDEVTGISHEIAQQFIGRANIQETRGDLAESHRTSYDSLLEDDLLNNYFVAVSEGATEDEVDLDIGIDVIGIIDRINVDVTVGDVVVNNGAA